MTLDGARIHALRQQGMRFKEIGVAIAQEQGRAIVYTQNACQTAYRKWRIANDVNIASVDRKEKWDALLAERKASPFTK